MSESGPAPDENICRACGMCCDGTMFDYARLELDEVPRAQEFGLAVIEVERPEGGTPAIPFPPLCHTSAGCVVYDRRFATCRRFRCQTLIALEAGEIDSAEGHRRVQAAKDALTALRPHLLPGESLPEARLRESKTAPAGPDALFLFRLWALDTALDRWFLKPSARRRESMT